MVKGQKERKAYLMPGYIHLDQNLGAKTPHTMIQGLKKKKGR